MLLLDCLIMKQFYKAVDMRELIAKLIRPFSSYVDDIWAYSATLKPRCFAALPRDRITRLVWILALLERLRLTFAEVRKKYAKFEGSLRGTDSRILIAQVPLAGMLTNMGESS